MSGYDWGMPATAPVVAPPMPVFTQMRVTSPPPKGEDKRVLILALVTTISLTGLVVAVSIMASTSEPVEYSVQYIVLCEADTMYVNWYDEYGDDRERTVYRVASEQFNQFHYSTTFTVGEDDSETLFLGMFPYEDGVCSLSIYVDGEEMVSQIALYDAFDVDAIGYSLKGW